jgi:hypothetical protein
MRARGVIFFLVLLCIAGTAAAQSGVLPSHSVASSAPPTQAIPPAQQLAELQRWTRDYTEWKTWFAQWRNRREPGWWSTRPRRVQPVPPPWLAGLCGSPLRDAGPLGDACRAFDDWSSGDEGAQAFSRQLAQARSQHEAPTKTAWWERIHVDALWPVTQIGANAFGVAGMHTTMSVVGRMQVFLTPGMLVMRVPTMQGGMSWSAATDWGFSYRLFDFRMPAANRASTLHFNIVRVWLLGQHAIQAPGEMYLAGFSITFKRK